MFVKLAQSKFVISAAEMSQKADNVLPYVFQAISWYQHISRKQICADFQDNAESNRLCTAE